MIPFPVFVNPQQIVLSYWENIWWRAAAQYGKLVNGGCKDEANAQIWENSFGNVERIPLYDFPSFNKQ